MMIVVSRTRGIQSELTQGNFNEVYRVLNPAMDMWLDIGIALGLPYNQLTAIENDFQRKSNRCLMEVINRWLQNGEQNTWIVLARAVKVLNRNDLYDKIMTEHCN